MIYPTRLFALSIFIFILGLLVWIPLEAEMLACSAEIDGDNMTDFTSADATAVQQAVTAVTDGGTVKVAGTCNGVQTLNGDTQTVLITKTLTLQGGYLATDWLASADPDNLPTILDADAGGSVVVISADVPVTLDGLIIRDGAGFNGGGILHEAGELTIQNSQVISNNATQTGGGISSFATVTVINSLFDQNAGDATGGAIYAGVHTTILSSTLSNHVSNGGTIANEAGATLIIHNTQIVDNIGRGGGALSLSIGSQTTVEDSLFARNLGLRGGAINSNNGVLTVTNSILDSNIAFDRGGAVVNAGKLTLRRTTISNNLVSNQFLPTTFGGAIYNSRTLVLENSTVSGNSVLGGSADSGGGAIDQFGNSAILTITHSTIVSNTAPNIAGRDGVWIESGTATIRNSIIANNGNADCDLDGGTFDGGGANLASDNTCTGFSIPSSNPQLGALQDNDGEATASGTPPATHLPASGSPVINAGNASDCLTVDQRNFPRNPNYCDLGAVDTNTPPTSIALLTQSTTIQPPSIRFLVVLAFTVLATATWKTSWYCPAKLIWRIR